MNHQVISPARILIGSYLSLCRVRSTRDLASGLFLCTLVLQYEELSKRYWPESSNFLINALLLIAPHHCDAESLPGWFPIQDFDSEHCRITRLDANYLKDLSIEKPNFVEVLLIGDDDNANAQAKINLLSLTFDLIGRFAELYKSLDGFIELFGPILAILDSIQSRNLPEALVVSP